MKRSLSVFFSAVFCSVLLFLPMKSFAFDEGKFLEDLKKKPYTCKHKKCLDPSSRVCPQIGVRCTKEEYDRQQKILERNRKQRAKRKK